MNMLNISPKDLWNAPAEVRRQIVPVPFGGWETHTTGDGGGKSERITRLLADIERLEGELDDVTAEIEELESERRRLETDLEEAQEELEGLEK